MNAAKKKKSDDVPPVVVMEKVERSFGDRKVLSDIHLKVKKGEMLGVVGPNGGGKSTLLFLAAGLVRPTEGRVTVLGVDAYSLSLKGAGCVGLVTARPGLYPLLTGRENLRHFGGLFGLSCSEVDEKAAPLARAFELDEGMEERVGRMSTGMQQKLSLIRALLLSPRLLLVDEPTANLDPIASRVLYTEIRKRVDDGLACLLVTHDLPSAESVCDRVVILDGKIKRELSFAERRAPLEGPLLKAWQEAVHR